jgi:hypothetical protein
MKTATPFVLGLFAITLSSCATARSADPEVRRRAAAIEILEAEAVGGRQHEIITEVAASACMRQGAEGSMEGVRSDLRIKAAEVNADAIINMLCERGGTSLTQNCWRVTECRGDAIRWKE